MKTATRQRNAIKSDRWDRLSLERTMERLERLPALTEELGDISWTAPPLVEDLYQAAYQTLPRPAEDLDPAYKPNEATLSALRESQAWRDLREDTVDDPTAAGMAVLAMREQLLENRQRLQEAQEKADEAQRRAEEYQEAVERAEGGEPGPDLEELLCGLGAAQKEADEALDRQLPGVAKSMREAAEKAAEQARDEAENARSWGMAPGELAAMDPADRIALGEGMRTPTLRAVMEKMGQLRNMYFGEHTRRLSVMPDEIHDIELGDDISRLLTSELSGLVIPEVEDDFYRRWLERQLLQYDLTATDKIGKGGIILLEDSSLSMAGGPTLLAKGLGLALERIAREEDRSFRAFMFGGVGQVSEWPCGTVQERLAYAGAFLAAGGTDWMGPLDKAIEFLDIEFIATGKVEADILLATDGIAPVDNDWLQGFLEARTRLGFKVWSVSIGRAPSPNLCLVSDMVSEITDLLTCSDIQSVFQRL